MKAVLALGKFVLTVLATVSLAFAISFLWGWFVVPLGIPAIGPLHAYGLILVASLFSFTSFAHILARLETSDERRKVIDWVIPALVIFASWFLTLIGYIVQLFM